MILIYVVVASYGKRMPNFSSIEQEAAFML